MAIRTVFWDIGGVLLTNGFGRRQRAGFYDALGFTDEDRAEFEARREDANWHWERGLIDDAQFFDRTVFYKPRALTLRDVWTALEAQQQVLHPECFDILKGMRTRGEVRLATLNNESRELNNFRLSRFGLRPCFQMFICSGYVGEMKPAPAIYRTALEISGDDPAETCFIDDKEENIRAAEAAGMQALHFRSPGDLVEQLRLRQIRL